MSTLSTAEAIRNTSARRARAASFETPDEAQQRQQGDG